ncbi:MAG: DUF222 domain-containing protein [Gemmatimonadota bacterium]
MIQIASHSTSDPRAEGLTATPLTTCANNLSSLGDEIAALAVHLDAAKYRLLVRLREFDEKEGWAGFRSCAHWLSWRTSLAPGAAREQVRVARALGDLPLLSEEMRVGRVSYSKARALTRVANRENEANLVQFAKHATATQVERLVRGWRQVDRSKEVEEERARHRGRSLTLFPDADGSWVVRGRLDPEVGALLQKAVEAAAEILDARKERVSDANYAPVEEQPALERRWADALGLVAEAALGEGIDQRDPGPREVGSPRLEVESGHRSTRAGRRADRFQVVIHVMPDDLRTPGRGAELSACGGLRAGLDPGTGLPGRLLGDDTRVSAETCRRIACDASLVPMVRGKVASAAVNAPNGVLDVGRRRRTVPPALRRALEARDGGCRFPGCGVSLRWCDAHHVMHWADGGATKLDNLVLLCRSFRSRHDAPSITERSTRRVMR